VSLEWTLPALFSKQQNRQQSSVYTLALVGSSFPFSLLP
jgi:hypothetical protein